MITVYGSTASGNCWKAQQVLRLVGLDYDWVEVNSNGGETRTKDFLARNPAGKIPIVTLANGEVITESNAILGHFAEGSSWLPPSGLARTRVYEWLFFEQYSHEPYIAVARNIVSYLRAASLHEERIAKCMIEGARALDLMSRRLDNHEWLTDAGPTIADVALFAYTHVADEGGFDLARWPSVQSWVARFAALPGVVPLPRASA